MNWHSAAEFFAMGGYGLYVWGSYAVAALCMGLEPVLAARRHAQAQRAAASLDEEMETSR
jgi:heme exporter protein D